MSDAPNFKTHALIFVLLYLTSRGLFTLVGVFQGLDGCGCLAHMSEVLAWPVFAASLVGLLVTGVRGRMRATGDSCPVCPTLLFLPPTLGAGWATVDALGYWPATVSWAADVTLVVAVILTFVLMASIRRERRAKDLPVARIVD